VAAAYADSDVVPLSRGFVPVSGGAPDWQSVSERLYSPLLTASSILSLRSMDERRRLFWVLPFYVGVVPMHNFILKLGTTLKDENAVRA